MSELRADTITASDGTSPVTLTKQSAAKAWLDYNQVTNTTDGSFNVSSVSDDATGQFAYTMTNSMDSANWSMPYTCNQFASQINGVVSSTQGKCRSRNASATDTDTSQNCACNHGDLA